MTPEKYIEQILLAQGPEYSLHAATITSPEQFSYWLKYSGSLLPTHWAVSRQGDEWTESLVFADGTSTPVWTSHSLEELCRTLCEVASA